MGLMLAAHTQFANVHGEKEKTHISQLQMVEQDEEAPVADVRFTEQEKLRYGKTRAKLDNLKTIEEDAEPEVIDVVFGGGSRARI